MAEASFEFMLIILWVCISLHCAHFFLALWPKLGVLHIHIIHVCILPIDWPNVWPQCGRRLLTHGLNIKICKVLIARVLITRVLIIGAAIRGYTNHSWQERAVPWAKFDQQKLTMESSSTFISLGVNLQLWSDLAKLENMARWGQFLAFAMCLYACPLFSFETGSPLKTWRLTFCNGITSHNRLSDPRAVQHWQGKY